MSFDENDSGFDYLKQTYKPNDSQEFEENLYEKNLKFFTPLGKVSKPTILQASKILDELAKVVHEYNNKNKVLNLSNEFYNLIPHQNYNSNLDILDNDDKIEEKRRLLRVLYNH